jgi:hypothetical protein
MEKYRVPQREFPVRITLVNGETLDGVLFAPATGPDGAPGRLVDRLNDAEEHFLPLARSGQAGLLQKGSVVAVHLDPVLGAAELHDGEHAREVRIRVILETNLELEGDVNYTMPPEKGRILDYLNAAPRFVPLLTGEGTTLFNRERVVRVEALAEPESE